MLKALSNMNKKGDFFDDSIKTKQQFSIQRDQILTSLDAKVLSEFSVNASGIEQPKTSIIDEITNPLVDLSTKWKRYSIKDHTQAFDRTGADMLIQLHKREIEFMDKPC